MNDTDAHNMYHCMVRLQSELKEAQKYVQMYRNSASSDGDPSALRALVSELEARVDRLIRDNTELSMKLVNVNLSTGEPVHTMFGVPVEEILERLRDGNYDV